MSNPAQGADGADLISEIKGLFGRAVEEDGRLADAEDAVDDLCDAVVERLFALGTPRTDSAERTAGEVLREACKPWELCFGDPPEYDSPLHGVFVAGMIYTERLLADLLSVSDYEQGDGSEDFDADATQSLRNILTGAGLWDADENRPIAAAPSSPGGPDSVRALSEEWTLSRAFDLGFSWAGTLYCSRQSMEDSRAVGRTLLHPEFDGLQLDLDGWDSFQSGDIGMCEGKRRIKEALDRISAHPAGQSTGQGAEDGVKSLADLAACHGRDWAVWWQGSGPERGDHIMELRQSGSGYARELAWIGDQHHGQAGALVAEHNEQMRRLREVIGRQRLAKELLQKEVAELRGPNSMGEADTGDVGLRRVQSLGAAISRREWSEVEAAHAAIRDALAARPAAPEAQGAWSLEPEGKPIQGFRNRAGETDTDDAIAFELEAAGIEVLRLEVLRMHSGEVKTAVRGELHGWSFKRAWRYWVAEGPGIELAAANVLYAAHPETVRVDGHCGCPSPHEWFKGLAVGNYHVDSPAGLKGLADTIKAIVARSAPPSSGQEG